MKTTLIFFLTVLGVLAYSSSVERKKVVKHGNEIVQYTDKYREILFRRDREAKIAFNKQTQKPNEAFRKKVLINIDNHSDVKIFNSILSKLDGKGLAVCGVIGDLFAIDDKCLANTKRKYPDPSQQNLFSNAYSSSIKREYEKYAKSINLTMEEIRFLNVAYAFNQHVKSFCGSF